MSRVTTYKLNVLQGGLPDDTSWLTEEDYERIRENDEYLKSIGEYGKYKEMTFHVVDNPLLQAKPNLEYPLESYRMTFLDFSEDEEEKH